MEITRMDPGLKDQVAWWISVPPGAAPAGK